MARRVDDKGMEITNFLKTMTKEAGIRKNLDHLASLADHIKKLINQYPEHKEIKMPIRFLSESNYGAESETPVDPDIPLLIITRTDNNADIDPPYTAPIDLKTLQLLADLLIANKDTLTFLMMNFDESREII